MRSTSLFWIFRKLRLVWLFYKISPFLTALLTCIDWLARHSPLRTMPKTMRVIIISAVILVLAQVLFIGTLYFLSQPPKTPHVTHYEFVELAKQKKIDKIDVVRKRSLYSDVYIGHFIDLADEKRKWAYLDELPMPPAEWLRTHGYNAQDRNKVPFSLETVLLWTGQGLIAAVPFFFFMWLIGGGGIRSMGEEFATFRHSKILLGKKTTFADVGGMEPTKSTLREYLDFLQGPGDYKDVGAHMPKGIFLYGLPGTGKTLIARAFAGEAGVPAFMASGSDFHFMFVGVGANRVDRLFDQAKRNAPSVVILDEIDSAAPTRGGEFSGADRERSSLTNKLLSLLDELEKEDIPVIVFGLTNRIDALDPALLRDERFDNRIYVPPPDFEARVKILDVHTSRPKKAPLDDTVHLDEIALMTPGWVGSKLARLVNGAKIRAVKRKHGLLPKLPGSASVTEIKVVAQDFFEEMNIIELGPINPRELTGEEKERIAYHEIGHALSTFAVKGTNPLRNVTLIMHGTTLGHTSAPPERDRHIQTETELLAQNKLLLAALAAELVIYGEGSTGSGHDIEMATLNTKKFVFEGMDREIGPISINAMRRGETPYQPLAGSSSGLEEQAELKVQTLLKKALDEMIALFSAAEWNKVLREVAAKLLEDSTLSGEQVKAMIPPELLKG